MSKKARAPKITLACLPCSASSIIDRLDYLKHTLRCRKLKSPTPRGKAGDGLVSWYRARLLIYLLRTSGRACLPQTTYQSPIPPLFRITFFSPLPLSVHALVGTLEENAAQRFQSCGYRQPFELLLQLNIRWNGYPGHYR